MFSSLPEHNHVAFRTFFLTIMLFAVCAAAVLYYSLPWGIGVSPDSVAYLKSASLFATDARLEHLPSRWPPGYPLFLALLICIVPNMAVAALLGQVMLFALNITTFTLVVFHSLQAQGASQYWIAALAGVLFACYPAVVLVHQHALSEALFIFCLLSSLGMCLWCLKNQQSKFLPLLAAMSVGCLSIVRYAGLPFIPLVTALIFFGAKTARQSCTWRIKAALTFATTAALPLLCWLTLNTLQRGQTTSRSLAYHPAGLTHAKQLWQSVNAWFAVPGPAPLTVLVMLCIITATFRTATALPMEDWRRPLVLGLPFAALAYVVFILIAISFVDAHTPLDQRILLPAWILLSIAALISLQASLLSRATYTVLLSAILLVLCSNALSTAQQISYTRLHGLGYHTPVAATSVFPGIVQQALPTRKLYSNASDYLFLHTGREVENLPRIYDANTREPNPLFLYEMASLLAEIENDTAAIVHLKGFEFRHYYPTSEQLQVEFSLSPTLHTVDGTYFR